MLGMLDSRHRVAVTGMAIGDRDTSVLPDCGGDVGEMRLVATAPEPARCIDVKALLRERGALREIGRECREQLELRRGEHRPEPEVADRARHSRGEQRLSLVRRKTGQAGPVAVDELDPAVVAGLGVDGHARGAECFEVPVDRPHRDFQLLGELLGRQRRRVRLHPLAQAARAAHRQGRPGFGARLLAYLRLRPKAAEEVVGVATVVGTHAASATCSLRVERPVGRAAGRSSRVRSRPSGAARRLRSPARDH
jgi:hypothetical protein